MNDKTIPAQSTDYRHSHPSVAWITLIISGVFFYLQLTCSSLVLYGIRNNKAPYIQAYILYRIFLIVLSTSLQIYSLISQYSQLAEMPNIAKIVVDVILFLYTFFLFVIQYNVVKFDFQHQDSAGYHTNPAYID